MGMVATKVFSVALRPIKSINIQNRAERIISKDPVPAPKHPSSIAELKRAQAVNPDFLEQHNRKDANLDSRLKNVFVKSDNPWGPDGPTPASRYNPLKPLPVNRNAVPIFDYGPKEPDSIPPGRIFLREALMLIWENQDKPEEFTAERLAEKYNLDVEHVRDIIKYHKTFKLYVPEPVPASQPPKKVSYASDLPKLEPPQEVSNPIIDKLKKYYPKHKY